MLLYIAQQEPGISSIKPISAPMVLEKGAAYPLIRQVGSTLKEKDISILAEVTDKRTSICSKT